MSPVPRGCPRGAGPHCQTPHRQQPARLLPRLVAFLAALTVGLLAGCGYTYGTGLDQLGVRSVALRFVGNQTWRQRLEVELTTALARELPVATDLQLERHGRADATLEVAFLTATEQTLVPGTRQDPVREGALEVIIQVRLVRRDGAVLQDFRWRERTEFRSPIGEDLASARLELANELARRIALSLEDDPLPR